MSDYTFERFNWDVHHEVVGLEGTEPWEAYNEAAIEFLVAAGYSAPETGNAPVDFAQTYLTLAFAHCPDLMDYVPSVTANQVGEGGRHRKLNVCPECQGTGGMHYLSCRIWLHNNQGGA